ncbi:hypothetical protein [Candidatus Spongiihabitans sp.]
MKPPKKITAPELADAARPALLSMPKKPGRRAKPAPITSAGGN